MPSKTKLKNAAIAERSAALSMRSILASAKIAECLALSAASSFG